MRFKLPTEITISRFSILALVMTVLMAQSVGNGNTAGSAGTTVTCTDTSITCAAGNLALNTTQPNANTWTATQTFTAGIQNNGLYNQNFNAVAACQTGAQIAEACFDGTSAIGAVIGPTGGYTSGSTGSQSLCFERTVSGAGSCANITYGTGGTLSFTAATGYNFGTGTFLYGQEIMAATCALSASGTMPAGTSACKLTFTGISTMTVTYAAAYGTQGICLTNDETTANGSRATACTATAATVTATSGDVVDFFVKGK